MIDYSEDQITSMGLTSKAIYGGKVVSFTCAATGDYVWSIEVLNDVLPLIQRKANKLVEERNRKLKQLFNKQSKRA